MTNRDQLSDMGYDEAIVFENPDYDDAIVGITTDDRVVYDFDAMCQHLIEKDGLSLEDAIDFIEYNTIRALPYAGEHAPIVYHPIERMES